MNEKAHSAFPQLLKRPAVQSETTLSRSKIYELMAEGKFPKPVSLGSNRVAWLRSEVFAWIDQRIAERNGGR
ncbi:MAG: AlpA family transcriptional regulator [Hahellaceae bacterium]|nr:AlpA family transcriptional regulator [Hahellaceae bacterium]